MFAQLSKKYKNNCAIDVSKYSKLQEIFAYKKITYEKSMKEEKILFLFMKNPLKSVSISDLV